MKELLYKKCIDEITELIELTNTMKDKIHIITIFDNPHAVEASSGMIYSVEIEDIEAGFVSISTNYTGYSNYSDFIMNIEEKKYSDSQLTYMVYSTAQIGKDINRRSYIPTICKQNSFVNLTCEAEKLCLLMDKSQYFDLIKPLSHIPDTDVYQGQKEITNQIASDYVILKPALECAATGVEKVKNNPQTILNKVKKMRKKYDQNIIIQEYIEGYEVSVPVLKKGNKYIALPPVWVKFKGDILTFETVDDFKYSFSVLPNDQFPYTSLLPKLMSHAESVMQLLGAEGLTRVDYRIKNEKDFFVIDLAALPVLANTGTCMQSFKFLFNDKSSIFKAIIGSSLY